MHYCVQKIIIFYDNVNIRFMMIKKSNSYNSVTCIVKELTMTLVPPIIPLSMDVIFDGGMFNGSYLTGVSFYLKDLERVNHIKIHRISACSVGAFIGVLYLSNLLSKSIGLYNFTYKYFKRYSNIPIAKFISKVAKILPENICELVNGRLFINYTDIVTRTSVVKSTFRNSDELIETLYLTSFIPFISGKTFAYKGRYIDGLLPHIFPLRDDRQILYIDLHGNMSKVKDIVCIKNEPSNVYRIMYGVLSVHELFGRHSPSVLCYFINDRPNSFYVLITIKNAIAYIIILLICAIQCVSKYVLAYAGIGVNSREKTRCITSIVAFIRKRISRFVAKSYLI